MRQVEETCPRCAGKGTVTRRLCMVRGCQRVAYAKGCCQAHYMRRRRRKEARGE